MVFISREKTDKTPMKEQILKILRKIWKDIESGLTTKDYEEGYRQCLKDIAEKVKRMEG